VHRDFKPANVLLGPDGPRVVDFGIARLIDVATMTSGVIGTPSYLSPEQLSGARPTSAVDIFAWAVTMVYAATGRPAFSGDSVMAVMHRILTEQPDITGVPASLFPVIRDCLNKDPLARPSARDLLLRLIDPSQPAGPAVPSQPARTGPLPQDDVPVRTAPVPAWPGPAGSQYGPVPLTGPGPGPRRSRRGPVLAAGGAALAAAVIAAVVLLLTQRSPAQTPAAGASSSPALVISAATASVSAAIQPAGATIPAAFAGTWSGTATMAVIGLPSVGLPNGISFTMAKGGTTAAEVNGSCTNTLTLTEVTATVLTFSEPTTDLCVAGTVTFTLRGANLAYQWTGGGEQNTATLHRK